MSWFDKLFGESSEKTEHTQDQTHEDDVYRRPRGKFRFPLNVENIKTAEHHRTLDNVNDAQITDDKHEYIEPVQPRRETYIAQNESVNTEEIRASFSSDYVPRRERRRGRNSEQQSFHTRRTETIINNEAIDRYHPKTRLNDAPKYTSYQPKDKRNSLHKANNTQTFSEKQYSVHQPKFKASVVPSAIYGTKPRKDPASLKRPIQPLQGKKTVEAKPATPTHRKEDNTVNIENVYASQIVAEIRREREKKLQRKKAFEQERELKKLQELEISSMMREEKSDVEYVHAEPETTEFDERVTIIEEDVVVHEPVINHIDLTEDSEEDVSEIEEHEIEESIDETEAITISEGERYTYSTKTPFNSANAESLTIIEAAEEQSYEDETADDGKEEIAEVEEVTLLERDVEILEQTSTEGEFLDENVTFEPLEEQQIEIDDDAYEMIDEDIEYKEEEAEEVISETTDVYTAHSKSLEPLLEPDFKQMSEVDVVVSGDSEYEAVDENSLEPVIPLIETEEDNEVFDELDATEEKDVIDKLDTTKAHASIEPVLTPENTEEVTLPELTIDDSDQLDETNEAEQSVVTGNINQHLSSGHYVQVENNEIKANIRDHQPQAVILSAQQPKKKVSPFNVVMTPSDKRRLLDKKRQAENQLSQNIQQNEVKDHLNAVEQTGVAEDVTIADDIQQSFEQQGTAEENIVQQDHNAVEEVKETEEVDIETVKEENISTTVTASQPQSNQIVSNNGYPVKKEPTKRIGPKYLLPPVSLLNPEDKVERDETWVEEHKAQLDDAFYHFNVPAKVENVVVGPSVTRFELSVEKGVKVSRITNLQDDIKMALAAKDIRIEAPIPGTSLVGVEVPNVETRNVNLSEVLFSKKMKFAESKLTVALGARINNEPMIMDLAKMPHGLIAGATGSGKSVCINSILVSLLYRNNPNELKLLLIDPKMVELAPYNDLPHLIAPVITDVKAATESLKWVVEEMERRYKIFADIHVRNITAYNQKVSYVERLPKIVIVIDELADLMMMSPQDVEHAIARIAQKARAAGIHMILATQRPSVNVITGLIKANVPTRIAFMVSSAVDSRTIIDSGGAEKLLGNGDMLYLGNGMNKPIRIQGNFVSDEEIDAVVQYVKTQGEPNYLFQEKELLKKVSETPKDELFNEICDFMIDEGHISTSQIQRRFQIGYNRAARIIDQLEEMGYVSGQNGSKPRAVLITEKQAEY